MVIIKQGTSNFFTAGSVNREVPIETIFEINEMFLQLEEANNNDDEHEVVAEELEEDGNMDHGVDDIVIE